MINESSYHTNTNILTLSITRLYITFDFIHSSALFSYAKQSVDTRFRDKLLQKKMFGQLCVWIVVAQFIRYVLPWLFRNFIGPYFLGDKINFKKYGEWAVVTGASDGIGKEFAKQVIFYLLISLFEEKY